MVKEGVNVGPLTAYTHRLASRDHQTRGLAPIVNGKNRMLKHRISDLRLKEEVHPNSAFSILYGRLLASYKCRGYRLGVSLVY